jgi:hypothetical protein
MPTPILAPYGLQPLGLITVAAAGTPVPLWTNIGTYYTTTGASEYAMFFNQIWVRASAGNTGAIYLVAPGQPASNTDAIIWYLEPGEFIFIGADSPARNMYGLDSFAIDAATSGNTAQVTGIVGG